MTSCPTLSRFFCLALSCALIAHRADAQEANVLGLPAIPQVKTPTPTGSTGTTGTGASTAAKPAAAALNNRDALAGELGLQHSALGGLGRLVVTTRTSFATAGAKSTALDAARTVQQGLAKSCGNQCKPEKMAAPKILSSGQLEFELSFRPLYLHLNQTQFLAAIQGNPLNLTAQQLTLPAPPVVVPVPGIVIGTGAAVIVTPTQ
jgi:hypothetical protein